MAEWIGCGPSAASQYRGERYQRPSNLDEWAAGMESRQPQKAELVSLDSSILMADAIIFGLRMNIGINLTDIALRFPAPKVMAMLEPLLSRFADEGLLVRSGAHMRLTHRGRLVCDAIGSAVLEVVV